MLDKRVNMQSGTGGTLVFWLFLHSYVDIYLCGTLGRTFYILHPEWLGQRYGCVVGGCKWIFVDCGLGGVEWLLGEDGGGLAVSGDDECVGGQGEQSLANAV